MHEFKQLDADAKCGNGNIILELQYSFISPLTYQVGLAVSVISAKGAQMHTANEWDMPIVLKSRLAMVCEAVKLDM